MHGQLSRSLPVLVVVAVVLVTTAVTQVLLYRGEVVRLRRDAHEVQAAFTKASEFARQRCEEHYAGLHSEIVQLHQQRERLQDRIGQLETGTRMQHVDAALHDLEEASKALRAKHEALERREREEQRQEQKRNEATARTPVAPFVSIAPSINEQEAREPLCSFSDVSEKIKTRLPPFHNTSGVEGVSYGYLMSLNQSKFLAMPRTVASNREQCASTDLWREEIEVAAHCDRYFSSTYAVLKLEGFCAAGMGGPRSALWDGTRVLVGQELVASGPSNASCHYVEKLAFLEMPWSLSFQHFLADELPRIAPMIEQLRNGDVHLVFEKGSKPMELLTAAGVPNVEERFLPYRLSSAYCANWLYYPHGFQPTFTMGKRPGELIQAAHRVFIGEDLPPTARDFIILAVRNTGKPSRARRMENVDDVVRTVERWMLDNERRETLHIWDEREHSVLEAISTWQRARIVIGVHGGALANLMFAPMDSDTSVIEICPTDEPAASWWDVAMGMRQDYWQLLVPNRNHSSTVEVDLSVLQQILEAIHREQVGAA